MIDSVKIGRAIRTLREKAGYTQKELADQLFLSNMAVSKWESGKSVPDISTLKRLAKILDMDIDGLVDGTATYMDDTWKGILILDKSSEVRADTILYDKPMIDYQISYFLLAGIREILISCSAEEREYIDHRFQGGKSLGIQIQFIDSALNSIWLTLQTERFMHSNIMLVAEPFFIYGVDLTRFIQRAMQNRNTIVNLISVIGDEKNSVFPALKTKESGFFQYQYQMLPVFFFQSDSVSEEELCSITEIEKWKAMENKQQYEPMDKGFIVSCLKTEQDAARTAQIVQCIQDLGRYEVCCPLEIAWRRGMIGNAKLKEGETFFPEYREHIETICEAQ